MAHDMATYGRAVQQQLPRLLLISLVMAVGAWVVVRAIGPTYQGHFSYLVSLSERETVKDEYRFDGFYALQATELFSATLAKWVVTPEVIVATYDRAGVELPSLDPRQLTGSIRAEKSAPQLVEIVIKHSDRQTVGKLAAALQQVMAENVDQYHDQGIPAVAFKVVTTNVWVGMRLVAVPVIVVAVFLVTLGLSINVVLWRESLRNPR